MIRPRTDGDYYRLKIDPEAANAVSVFALPPRCSWRRRSWGPRSRRRHPDAVEVVAYEENTGVNLVILVDWDRWGRWLGLARRGWIRPATRHGRGW